MIAEPISQEVTQQADPDAPATVFDPDAPPTVGQVLAVAEMIADERDKLANKLGRMRSVNIKVKPWEQEYPAEVQTKLFFLRQEVHFANKALEQRNATIKQLRHEVRLYQRVMRLKAEAAERIDKMLAQRSGS